MQAILPFPDIDPTLFSIEIGPVTLALRWYALAYIAGLVLGWRIVTRMMARPALWAGKPPMTAEHVENLLTWVILAVVLGGRLGFVLFYQPSYYLQNPDQILKIWQGGMSFHGGMLGVAIAVMMFCRRHALPLLSVGDALAVVAPIGLFFGRLANFINAELWGRPSTLPWAVPFPGDGAYCPEGWVGLCTRHPSQLYEALMEGVLLGALVFYLAWRRGWLKYPGGVTGVFLAGYGVARFIVEFVRQPDLQFFAPDNPLGHAVQFGSMGLTMGQLLSLPMIAIGLAFALSAARRAA